MAAVSLAPYEHTQHIALIALLVLDVVILVVFVLFARVLVHRALRPVAWMTAHAKDWSEQEQDLVARIVDAYDRDSARKRENRA